jgi:hypothetical protein
LRTCAEYRSTENIVSKIKEERKTEVKLKVASKRRMIEVKKAETLQQGCEGARVKYKAITFA